MFGLYVPNPCEDLGDPSETDTLELATSRPEQGEPAPGASAAIDSDGATSESELRSRVDQLLAEAQDAYESGDRDLALGIISSSSSTQGWDTSESSREATRPASSGSSMFVSRSVKSEPPRRETWATGSDSSGRATRSPRRTW